MSRAYGRMGWGLLFVIVDFKLDSVDMLPDMLGYLLIASGLWRLQKLNGYFKAGHLSAWLLMAWSVLQLFWFTEAGIDGLPVQSAKDVWIQLPALCLHTVLIYGICRGVQAQFRG